MLLHVPIAYPPILTLARNQNEQDVVIKSISDHRLQNERDTLLRFQSRTPFIRPLIDEIEDPPEVPAIVLKYLDSDLLAASDAKRLTRPEIREVAKAVLVVLKLLHSDGYVHTGMVSLTGLTWGILNVSTCRHQAQ